MEVNTKDSIIDREQYEERSSIHHHRRPKGHLMMIRNILNLIFMIFAVTGVIIYCIGNPFWGVIIIGIGSFLKMVEFCIRFIDK